MAAFLMGAAILFLGAPRATLARRRARGRSSRLHILVSRCSLP